MEFLIPVLIILFLLFISAFFSGGELAMMALDPIALETRVRKGSLKARLQQSLRSHPQRFLSMILIGNNVANIALTTYATVLAITYLEPQAGWSRDRASGAAAIAVLALVTIFAELLPKTVAAMNTVQFANLVIYPMYALDLLAIPLTWLVEKAVMPLISLFTGRRKKRNIKVKRADIATALSLAHAGGELHQTDANVAYEALQLSTRDLEDVMTPRVDVVAAGPDCSVGHALTIMTDTGFTRLPIHGEDMDDINGVLLLKDLVRVSLLAAEGGRDPEDRWANLPAGPHRRDVAHLPESKSVVDTLAQMQRDRIHMVVVVDEHGGTAGIVTLEDIIEELVGEIHDESDPAGADILRRTESYTIASGRARIDQLPELEDADLSDLESSTIGGLMMELLGRPAIVGDEVTVDSVRISALKVLHNRIKLLRIEPVAAKE